jgi:hypothetical protein
MIGFAQLGRYSKAVFAGKHDIEDNQVELGVLLQQEVERGLAIARHARFVAFRFEIELQSAGKMLFVLDQQNLTSHD